MSQEITIDPEFRDLIPPLTPNELEQLHRSLDDDGCRDSLLVWQGILIDGHNRFSHCKTSNIKFQIREMSFPDRHTAKDYVILNQLGRRNLSADAAALLRGKLYNGTKKQGKRSDLTSGKSCTKSDTAEKIAKDSGVSPRTVKNDAKFAEAADATGETAAVIAGTSKKSRKEVIAAAKEKRKPEGKPTKAAKKKTATQDNLELAKLAFRKLSVGQEKEFHQWLRDTRPSLFEVSKH
jgi:hypothetical protein